MSFVVLVQAPRVEEVDVGGGDVCYSNHEALWRSFGEGDLGDFQFSM
jgi:hypothetical protein